LLNLFYGFPANAFARRVLIARMRFCSAAYDENDAR